MTPSPRRRWLATDLAGGGRLRPYVEPSLLVDTMRTAYDVMRACMALNGQLRPQVLARDDRGLAAGVRIELSHGGDVARLCDELHNELPSMLLEMGARCAVFLGDDRAVAVAGDRWATPDASQPRLNLYAFGLDAAGSVALTLATVEKNEYGDVLAGRPVLFDNRDRDLIGDSIPTPLWRGLGFCSN